MRSTLLSCLSLFLALNACAISSGNQGQKVADLSDFDPMVAWDKFEGEVQKKYAYIDAHCGDSLEQQFAHSRKLALASNSKSAFRQILHQTALTFCDPHFNVGPFAKDDYSIVMTGADIAVTYEKGRFFVADVRQHSAAFEAGVRPKWEVLTIGGTSALEAASMPFGSVLPNPNEAQLSFGATIAASGRLDRGRSFTFTHDGQIITLRLPHPYTHMKKDSGAPLLSTKMVGNVGIIRIHNSLGDNSIIPDFDDTIEHLKDIKTIILDLRNTPSGGNTEVARSIIGHFINQPQPYQMHKIPVIEREYGVPRQFVEYALPRPPYFSGQLIVLHGRWTGSMGEGLVIGLNAAAKAHTIGSDMGDLLGALWTIDLPSSGVRIEMGGEALFHINGTPREDYIADTPLKYADTDESGSDPALRAALAHMQQ